MVVRLKVFVAVLIALVSCLSVPRLIAQELLHALPAGMMSRHLAFSEDDRFLAGVGGTNATGWWVAVWDVATGEEKARLPLARRSDGILFVPGGEQLALLDEPRGSITLWEFLTGSIRRIDVIDPESDGALSSFAISHDGTHVAVFGRMGRKKNAITVRHIFDGSHVADLKIVGYVRQIVFGSDNASLTVADERYNRRKKRFAAYVCKWDVEDGEQTKEWGPFPMAGTRRRGNTLGYAGIHLSPDGRMLATIRGNRIVVIEVATGRHRTVGPHPSTAVVGATGEFGSSSTLLRALAFDPSAYVLATGAVGSQAVWLWSIAGSSSAEQFLQPDLDSVRALMYSPSGRLLAAGSIVYGKPSHAEVNVWRMKGDDLPVD